MVEGKAKANFEKWSKNKGFENWNPKIYSLDIAQTMYFSVLKMWLNKNGLFPTIIDDKLEDDASGSYEENKRFHSVMRTHERWIALGFHKDEIEALKDCIEYGVKMYNKKYENEIS